MDRRAYLERLEKEYSEDYRLVRDYDAGGLGADLYAFRELKGGPGSVQTIKAGLFGRRHEDHVLVFAREEIIEATLERALSMVEHYGEPFLVRRGASYPGAGHGCSYLTLAFISDREPEPDVIRAIQGTRKHASYLLGLRGSFVLRILLVSVQGGRDHCGYVYCNPEGRKLKTKFASCLPRKEDGSVID